MKKTSLLFFASALLVLAASCTQEANVTIRDKEEVSPKTVEMTILATEKPAVDSEVASKTFIDGTLVKWSNEGEILKVYEVATPEEGALVTTKKESAQGVTTDSGATMSFGVTMDKKSSGYTAFDYYAVYPSSAVHGETGVGNVSLNTIGSQTPSATNFDASQDLLIAKKIENGASQASTLEMQFARVVAIGKMTVKNLESTDDISKITFSAKIGDEPVVLAGRTAFNLETATPVSSYGSNTQEFSIILDYEGQSIKANSAAGMVAYFTCYPFAINSENPGSFKVVVETETETFTKEVSVSSAKGLAFNIGKSSIFSVDMDGIAGETKSIDLCYAFLEYSDVSGQLTNSYGNASVTKTHGDRWSMNATNASSSVIALKNGDASSYIKLPDFEDDITSVTVTLSEVTATKTLTFDSTQGDNSGDLGEVAFVAGTLEYTVDLSSANVKTAYIHSNGSQAKIVKVEVVAGSDTRTAIDAPSTVTAALNNDDVDVTNSIDISWSSVDGAAGYVITLVPDTGEDVVRHVGAVTSTTIEDLQYEMDYLISVQAEPADYYLNKISAQTTYGDVVTTGAAPSGAITLTENEIAASGNAVKGTNNGKLAYRVGTGSATGTLTFDAGYESITFSITGFGSSVSAFSITNGTIGGNTSYNPGTGNASGTLNAGFSTSYAGNEVTITVTDPTEQVVITGKRYVMWGFTAVESTPDTRDDASLVWKKNSVAADSDTASLETGDDTLPTITLDNSAHSHPVTYSSSETGVATIVESGVGAGTITLVAAGETTISAIFAGDEDYKPLTVSYTLTVSDNRTKVATPTFSPDAGAVAANSTVTISCGTADATIHYTVDGSTPTAESTVYSSAISIDAAKTIKAIAVKSDYKNSDVAEAAYTIAGVSSTISQVLAGGAGSYTINNILVYAVVGNQAIVGDNTGKMVLYKSGHGLAVGDNISIPSATVDEHSGILQIQDGTFNKNSTGNSVDHGTATNLNDSGVASSINTTFSASGYHAATFVTMNGTQSSRNIAGSYATLYMSLANNTYDGKAVTVTGYIYYYNSSYSNYNFQVVSIAPDESTPTISVTPASLSWAADATDNKTLAVTLNGAADAGDYSYEVTSGTAGDWNISDNNAGTITVSPKAANQSTENAKSITLRIKHADNASVYQDVTCTQAKANAGDPIPDPETITFANLGLTNGVQYLDPFDGGNFTITFAGGGNDGKYYTTGSGMRTYGGGTITIESTHNISQISFTWSGGDSYKPAEDVASPTGYNASTSKWTGEATSITLTRPSGSGHWRLQSVTVTYAD